MDYKIWRKKSDGKHELIGTAKFFEDAVALLGRWHEGKITKFGKDVHVKDGVLS